MREIYLSGEVGAEITVEGLRAELEKADGGPVRLLINSGGGNAWVGAALVDEAKRYQGGVEMRVTGLAASAASYLLTAADRVVVTDSSTIMLHDPYSLTVGDAAAHQKSAEILDRLGQQLAVAYARKMQISTEAARELMRQETWYSGQEAVEAKIADVYEGDEAEPMDKARAVEIAHRVSNADAAAPEYWQIAAKLSDDGADLSPEDREAMRLMGVTAAEYRELRSKAPDGSMHSPRAQDQDKKFTSVWGER
jgi:ATP-dependent protease ClpP protease subunit